MKIMRLAVVLCAALVLTACLDVTTKEPVGSTAGMLVDPALLGVWAFAKPDGKRIVYLHFLEQKDGSITAIWVEAPHGDDKGRWWVLSLQTATLGGSHFANVRFLLVDGERVEGDPFNTMFPLRYHIQGNEITIYQMDDSGAAAAVEAGKISGEIHGVKTHITAGPSATDAFFASKDGVALFSEPWLVLTRVE